MANVALAYDIDEDAKRRQCSSQGYPISADTYMACTYDKQSRECNCRKVRRTSGDGVRG